VARSSEDANDFAELDNSVEEMPKIRGNYGTSKPVQQLMEAISDGEVHRITNADDKEKVARWSRKLRYAANKLDKEVSVVYVSDANPENKPAGVYFRGYEKGKAPTRGRRKNTISAGIQDVSGEVLESDDTE